MTTKSLEATEEQCAAGRTAPRVSLDDIKNSIANYYFVTGDKLLPPTIPLNDDTGVIIGSARVLTICMAVMKNGFIIIGKAAPASPENFDPELGKDLAFEDVIRQAWPLMGFALRDRLANQS
jgi:hypothetical protein